MLFIWHKVYILWSIVKGAIWMGLKAIITKQQTRYKVNHKTNHQFYVCAILIQSYFNPILAATIIKYWGFKSATKYQVILGNFTMTDVIIDLVITTQKLNIIF